MKKIIWFFMVLPCLLLADDAYAQGFTAGGREGELDVRGRLNTQGDNKLLDDNQQKLEAEETVYTDVAKKTNEVVQCHTQGLIPDGEGGCKSVEDLLPTVLDKSKLELWLDASDENSLERKGMMVSQWQDKSGKGHVLEQLTAAEQPYYEPGTKSLDFSNMSVRYLTANSSISTSDYTIFVVTAPTISTEDQTFIAFKHAGVQHSVGAEGGTGRVFYTHNNIARKVNLPQASVDATRTNVIAVRPQASDDNKRLRLFNYYIPFSDSSLASVGYPAVSGSGIRVGAGLVSSIADTSVDNRINEIIIYGRTLDDTETEEITNYLISKWNITPPVGCGGSSQSILGQCNASAPGYLHQGSSGVSCTGTYGTCTATATCNNGSLSLGSTYCTPPANCVAGTSVISNGGQSCTATVAAMNHGATPVDISCKYAGAYGDCIGKANCNNGTLSTSNAYCAPLNNCAATTSSNCTLGATSHSNTSGSCKSGYTGTCSYQCLDGNWSQQANACVVAGCPDQDITVAIQYSYSCTTRSGGFMADGSTKTVQCFSSLYGGEPKAIRGTATCSGGTVTVTDAFMAQCSETLSLGDCTTRVSVQDTQTVDVSCNGSTKKYSGKATCNYPTETVSNITSRNYYSCARKTNHTVTFSTSVGSNNYTFSTIQSAAHGGTYTGPCTFTSNVLGPSCWKYSACKVNCFDGIWMNASNGGTQSGC